MIEMDEEYLKLFEQINKQDNNQQNQMLKETPNYNNMPNLNETPNTKQYSRNENLNDGWGNLDFQIEKRINGVPQQNNNPYQQQRRRNRPLNDPNGLFQYMDDENLNEVYRQPTPIQITHPVADTTQLILENIQNVDVVSVELFNKINESAFISLSKTIK